MRNAKKIPQQILDLAHTPRTLVPGTRRAVTIPDDFAGEIEGAFADKPGGGDDLRFARLACWERYVNRCYGDLAAA